MLLTTKQVASKLKIKDHQVQYLVKAGRLATANASGDGKRRNHLFDPAIVRAFASTFVAPTKHNGAATLDTVPPALARFDRLEQKIDTLLQAVIALTRLWE